MSSFLTVIFPAAAFEAADELGMRFSPTRGSMSLSKKDGGLPPDSCVQTEEKILEDSERCIKQFHDASPFIINSFYDTFPEVRDFFFNIVNDANKDGYIDGVVLIYAYPFFSPIY